MILKLGLNAVGVLAYMLLSAVRASIDMQAANKAVLLFAASNSSNKISSYSELPEN